MNLMHYLKNYTDYAIFGILGLMSLIMIYKVIERSLFYRKININKYSSLPELELDLTRGLTPIYTAGSTAPYVGLLGTVIGILMTFYDMGQANGDIEAGQIMIGLALALKATAAGIAVAIPAVIFYNMLSATIEAKKLAWQAQHQASSVAFDEKI